MSNIPKQFRMMVQSKMAITINKFTNLSIIFDDDYPFMTTRQLAFHKLNVVGVS
jgi:hypothetical protein